MSDKKDTFCIMPFHHINIKNEGKISTCWRYPNWIGDFTEVKLKEAWNGDVQKKVRRELLNGIQHSGCKSCWDLEFSGAQSLRNRAQEMYPDVDKKEILSLVKEDGTYPTNKISSVEIRFDNICNLMCRHCSPVYSSVWEQVVKKEPDLLAQQEHEVWNTTREKDKHVALTQDTIDEVVEMSPHLTELMITGGEPLYHSKHYDFLERCLPEAQHITLQYNSNFSKLDYKGKSILDLWRHFKRVSIRVSLDSYPAIYDYVRVRGNLPTAEKNIKLAQELPNMDLSATCTASLLNVTRMHEIAIYYYKLGVKFHTSLVQYPRALNPKLLPQALKNKATRDWYEFLDRAEQKQYMWMTSGEHIDDISLGRWKKFGNNVINYMNGEDWSQHWHEFIDYMRPQDRYHNTNILDVYPEFEPYWEN
tara:strand:+ start:895 stop:2151 length:1257 start_codon:yes stop_codon:yes gene_type:complete